MPILKYKEQVEREGGELPRLMKIKKGKRENDDPKGRPIDLSYFRCVPEGDPVTAAVTKQLFHDIYGDKPQKIKIIFDKPTVEDVFDYWMEAHNSTMIMHRCDGERCVLLRDPETLEMKSYYHLDWHDRPKCPGGCKERGVLKAIVDGMGRAAYAWIYTGSKWDVLFILKQLKAISELLDRLHTAHQRDFPYARGLAGAPINLYRSLQSITAPIKSRDGKTTHRAKVQKWLLTLELDNEWAEETTHILQENARPRLATPDHKLLADLQSTVSELYGPTDISEIVSDGIIVSDDEVEWEPVEDEEDDSPPPQTENGSGRKRNPPAYPPRPFEPVYLAEYMKERAEALIEDVGDGKAPKNIRGGAVGDMLLVCNASTKAGKEQQRHILSEWFFGRKSSNTWSHAEALAVIKWVGAEDGETGRVPSMEALKEAEMIFDAYAQAKGQQELPERVEGHALEA